MSARTVQQLFDLSGRTALVTGGSRGIGRMIAAGFLKAGARRVYITARKAEACDATARELSALGDCVSMPLDVSSAAGVQALAAAYAAREPHLDILVNNAGAAWGAPYAEFPESGWDKVADLNMKTPFFLTQALTPLLKAAATDHLAKVIHIASIDGISVNPWETYSYAASKAGLIHLTKRMALTLAPERIIVSAIAPGPFASEMNKSARDHADEVAQHVLGAESDFGGGRIWRMSSRVAESALPVVDQIYRVLAPLGIERGDNLAGGGADLSAMRDLGMPIIGLNQDGTQYFDYHHTAADTLDKLNATDLDYNVAAYAAMAYLAAQAGPVFGPVAAASTP